MVWPDRATLAHRWRVEWPQLLRIVIAAAVGWWVCILIQPGQVPVFAVVVPLLAMRDQPFSALNLSIDRVLGVIGGVLLGIAAVAWLGVSALAAALVVVVGLLAGVVLRLGPTLNIQVTLSGILVLSSTDPGTYGLTRFWETLVGAVVTVVLSPFLFPPDAAAQYRTELRRVGRELADELTRMAALAEDAAARHGALVALLDDVQRTTESGHHLPEKRDAAHKAVRNNPLRRRRAGEVEALAEVTETVVEIGRWTRILAEELVDLSRRPDAVPLWTSTGPFVARALPPLAAVLVDHLPPTAGRDAAAPLGVERADVHETTQVLRDWRAADTQPLAVVLRRPVFRLARLVGSLAGEPVSIVPPDPQHEEQPGTIG